MNSGVYSSEEYREGILYHAKFNEIFTAVATHLKEQKFFQEWEKEKSEIIKKYPIFENILQKGEGNVSLTEEEHKALVRYVELQDKMENAERQECYYIGQIHANMHHDDLRERMDSAAMSGRGGDKTVVLRFDSFNDLRWNHEEQPEFMADFIQRLQYSRDKRLKKNPGYMQLEDEERMILKRNPFLQSFLEADEPTKERKLTIVQQQALVDLIAVWRNRAPYEELEMVQMGMKLCMQLLDVVFNK